MHQAGSRPSRQAEQGARDGAAEPSEAASAGGRPTHRGALETLLPLNSRRRGKASAMLLAQAIAQPRSRPTNEGCMSLQLLTDAKRRRVTEGVMNIT